MAGICELLDAGHPERPYSATLRDQQAKLQDVELTPSARLLRELRTNGESFAALALRYSVEHRRYIDALPGNLVRRREFELEAQESLAAQRSIEQSQKGSFDEYLARYLAD
jgi:glutamate--cysteine ligase